jgi:hypothetical protein
MRAGAGLAIGVLVLTVGGCSSLFLLTTFGNAQLASETRDVGVFSRVNMRVAGQLNVTIGDYAALEITGDSNIVPLVSTEVSGDTLTIRFTQLASPVLPIVINVTVPDLTALQMQGAGAVTAGDLDNAAFDVTLSGAGDVTLSGQTDALGVTLSGAGDLLAENLVATAVTVNLSSSGNADVNATGTLDVTITGVGSVTYTGNPTITQTISGLGTVAPKGS